MHFLIQDEETKDSNEKKKAIFISPYMRYKCVIPMIMHHETKEREKQQKENEKEEEEEKRSTINAKVEHIDESEINESKSRVYEHFKQICQTANKEVVDLPKKKKKKKKTCKQLTLGQMHGRKRKRESDIKNEIQVNRNNDFSTPTSPIKVIHMSKKIKREIQETNEERKVQDNNSEIVTSLR